MNFQVMAKPSGASCNLSCRYCFYTEKEKLYRNNGAKLRMGPEILEEYIKQYIAAQNSSEIQFAWQGGEPTLMGVNFFESVLAIQQKYGADKSISNTIQTNGTLLNDAWCSFFAKNDFLVGLSIDGPQELHDRYRVKAKGEPTFQAVMSGVQLLKKHGVEFNTLTVINDQNSLHPLEVYTFLKEIGDNHMQFIPAVERTADTYAKELGLGLAIPPSNSKTEENLNVTPWSVSPKHLATFYLEIFNYWVRNDVGKFFVQFFDIALGNWLNAGSGLCHFSPQCGFASAIEHNGDLYSCDHYVYPQHKLGNIMETPLSVLMQKKQQRMFGESKWRDLPDYCKQCDVYKACYGDCPKHRFAKTPDKKQNLSYLCPAYKEIFTTIAPYMGIMAQLVRQGRPAPEIMEIVKKQDLAMPQP